MKINPTNQSQTETDLRELFDNLRIEIMKAINCMRPGVIESYDAATQTATVKIAQKQVTSIMPDGTRTFADYPLLQKVPVEFPGGGGATMTFPVAAGDECIIEFADRQLDNWILQGAGQPPTIARLHDLSDAICRVGIRSQPRKLSGVSASAVQLRSDDGTSFVELNPAAQSVHVHAGKIYSWDVQGYGQKITWTGGSNYTIDNYTIGAVITTSNHNINPPVTP